MEGSVFMMRLDKFLCSMDLGTRSEIKKKIRSGLVRVDQTVIRQADFKVDEINQQVYLEGSPVHYEKYVYYLMNKPSGVVSATRDNQCKTVLDLLKEEKRSGVSPVGRLDKDTTGLLLLTNDGALTHRLLSPAHHVDKVYEAVVDRPMDSADQRAFAEGIDIGDEKLTLPACLELLTDQPPYRVRITLQEGRFHQVKRMCLALGKEVLQLKRTAMGPLTLDDTLPEGGYRRLTQEELNQLCCSKKTL